MIPHDANSAAEERRRMEALDRLAGALAELLTMLTREGPEYTAVVLRRAAKLLESPPAPPEPGLPGPEAVARAARAASARAQRRALNWGS